MDISEKDEKHAYSETALNQEEKDYWKGGVLIGAWNTVYGVESADILGSEKGCLTVERAGGWGGPDNATHYDYSWAYITGHQNAIDLPGEWIIRGDTLFILPPEGETAETLTLEIKKRMLIGEKEREYADSCDHHVFVRNPYDASRKIYKIVTNGEKFEL